MWLIDSGAGLLDDLRDRGQPDLLRRLAGHRRRDIDVLERAHPPLELRLDFEHDAITDSSMRVKIVDTSRWPNALYSCVVDCRRRDAEAAGRGAIEFHRRPAIRRPGGRSPRLPIAAAMLQPVDELVHPGTQFPGIHGLDGELVLGVRPDPILDRQVLHRLHEQRDAVDLRPAWAGRRRMTSIALAPRTPTRS